jgi:hypothetical protein
MISFDGVQYVFGCDPEVFLWNTETNQYVGAYGFVPGTKEAPYKLDGGMVQVDGLALEFGIDPAVNENDFVDKIKHIRNQIQTMLPKHIQMRVEPIVEFSEAVMAAQLPENLELGCEPDYDAYTKQANPAPTPPSPLLRSGGGHIHIGWGVGLTEEHEEHFKHCCLMVRQLDCTVGTGSLFWDKATKRREIYGKAGCFRPKPYGLEYRTPSNAWLRSEEITRLAFRLTKQAIERLHKLDYMPEKVNAKKSIDQNITYKATKLVDSVATRRAETGGYLVF